MKRQLRISRQAVQDIEHVLGYTLEQFGARKHQQYKALIRLALADIAKNPFGPPAKHRPEIHADARMFHIARRGKRARHLFLFRVVWTNLLTSGAYSTTRWNSNSTFRRVLGDLTPETNFLARFWSNPYDVSLGIAT
jgi:toxin ParE1/3/4